jgi:hypothetical protein
MKKIFYAAVALFVCSSLSFAGFWPPGPAPSNEAYNEGTWNGSQLPATKDAIRDALEASAATDDQTASEVPFTPAGDIEATDTQSAIQELDGEKTTSDYADSAAAAILPTGWVKDGTGNMLIPDGNGFKPYTTTDGDSFSIWVYDVDATSYVKCLTFTNGNSPSVTLESGCDFNGFDTLQIDQIISATTDGDMLISGNGSGAVIVNDMLMSGQKVVTKTAATYTVGTDNAYESLGGLFINYDDDAIAFTLDTAAAGKFVCFENAVTSAGAAVTAAITVTAGTGDKLVKAGVAGSAAGSLASSGAAGDKICFVAIDATHWNVESYTGTWSVP